VTRAILQNLPAYRSGLTPLLRGLEVGLAHGYFLWAHSLRTITRFRYCVICRFPINNWFNYHSNFALTIYGVASFGQENQSHQMKMICKLKNLGSIQGGFFWWCVRKCGICIYLFVKYSFTAS
jgi:photosystem I subunit 11